MNDQWYLDQLKNHELEVVQEGAVSAYYLKRPGTRMMSTLITFSPEGIAIMGDLTPELYASVSKRAHGIEWFTSKHDKDYLCGKFLTEKWSQDAAKEAILDPDGWVRRGEDAVTLEAIDEIADGLCDHGDEWLCEQLGEIGYGIVDGIPGYGYLEREAGWLYAIQRKFAELYHAAAAKAGGTG